MSSSRGKVRKKTLASKDTSSRNFDGCDSIALPNPVRAWSTRELLHAESKAVATEMLTIAIPNH
eukprot:4134471-Amphidinium_carterae.2